MSPDNISLINSAPSNIPQDFVPPEGPTVFDFIELGFNAFCFLIGFPLNLMTLLQLLRKYRRNANSLTLLHINLNISDIMVLTVYSLGRSVWHWTFEWYGGDFLCRLMRFLETVSFSISSNIIVSIGIDRLMSLSNLQGLGHEVSRKCWCMLLTAWVLAILLSAPQLAVWTLFSREGFNQCLSYWVFKSVAFDSNSNTNGEVDEAAQADDKPEGNDDIYDVPYDFSMILYNVYHVSFIFWIPALCICTTYTLIVRRIVTNLDIGVGNKTNVSAADCGEASARLNHHHDNGDGRSPSPVAAGGLCRFGNQKPAGNQNPPQQQQQQQQQQLHIQQEQESEALISDTTNTAKLQAFVSLPDRFVVVRSSGSAGSRSSSKVQQQQEEHLSGGRGGGGRQRSGQKKRRFTFFHISNPMRQRQHRTTTNKKTSSTVAAAQLAAVSLNRVSGADFAHRNKMRAVRTSLLLTVFYVTCWIPYMTLSLWMSLSLRSYNRQEQYVHILFGLIVLNSVVNPVIYGRLQLFKFGRRRRDSSSSFACLPNPFSCCCPYAIHCDRHPAP